MYQWKWVFFPNNSHPGHRIQIVHFKNIYTSDSTCSRTCCINFVFPRKSFFIICSLTFCTKCSLQLSDSVQVNLRFVWPLCVFMLQVQMQVCTQQQLYALDRRLKLRTSTFCKKTCVCTRPFEKIKKPTKTMHWFWIFFQRVPIEIKVF